MPWAHEFNLERALSQFNDRSHLQQSMQLRTIVYCHFTDEENVVLIAEILLMITRNPKKKHRKNKIIQEFKYSDLPIEHYKTLGLLVFQSHALPLCQRLTSPAAIPQFFFTVYLLQTASTVV